MANSVSDQIKNWVPHVVRETVFLRTFGLLKVPMILFVSPSVVEMGDERCVVKIPLNWRTKNHLNSMYFGVLCAGADCAAGLSAMRQIQNAGNKVALSFKDFKATFTKRAEGDVHFVSTQGVEISELVQKALDSGERQNLLVKVTAVVPSQSDEPVAQFELTLSLKKRSKKSS